MLRLQQVANMAFFIDPNKKIFATHSCLECTEQQLLKHRHLQHVDARLNCNVHNFTMAPIVVALIHGSGGTVLSGQSKITCTARRK